MRILKLAGAALVLVAIISIWIVGDRSRIGELQSLQAPAEETIEVEDPERPAATSTPEPAGVDMTAPQLISFSFLTKNIDSSTADVWIQFTARVTDDLTGLGYAVLRFTPATGSTQFVDAYLDETMFQGDTRRDGIYQGSMRLPKHSATGRWYMSAIQLADGVRNGCGTYPLKEMVEMPDCELAIEHPYFINGEDSGPIVEPQPVPVETSEPLPPDNGTAADATPWANELRLPVVVER